MVLKALFRFRVERSANMVKFKIIDILALSKYHFFVAILFSFLF